MKMHKSLSLERVIKAGKLVGFCVECGVEEIGCSPSTTEKLCEECGAESVYGAAKLAALYSRGKQCAQ